MKQLFVTGVYRSGTTLLEKILYAHPHIYIASQPCPTLYFHLKRIVNTKWGINTIYPIGPDFGEAKITQPQLQEFLQSHKINKMEWQEILQEMKHYHGQYTSSLFDMHLDEVKGTFLEVIKNILLVLANNSGKKELKYAGSKEILIEEFTPYLIKNGCKVLHVLRDPKDIITSLNFGKGTSHTGAIRPILYSLRLWRKSVAYAIINSGDPNYMFIRYEDLVLHQQEVLKKMADFLELSSFETNLLKDQSNAIWKGNSSFEDFDTISHASVGRYRQYLSKEVVEYIETICFSELNYLKYSVDYVTTWEERIIDQFIEPFSVTNSKFDKDYSSSVLNKTLEINRGHLLNTDATSSEMSDYFIFDKVYNELKRVNNE